MFGNFKKTTIINIKMADIMDIEHHQHMEEYKQFLDELMPNVGDKNIL